MENMTKEILPLRKPEHPLKGVRFVGFDLDGTLLQQPLRSHPEVFGDIASRLFNIPTVDATKLAQVTAGISTEQQLNGVLPNGLNISSNLQKFVADGIDMEFFNQSTQLFPEVLDVLEKLKDQDVTVFISSSRPTTNIQKVLQDHPELASLIDFAIGTDLKDVTQTKGEGHFRKVAEHFGISFDDLVNQSLFIGDTPSDMKSAQAIGVKAIARNGTVDKDNLISAGAFDVLDDFSSLPFLLDSERTIPSENLYERREKI